MTDLSGRTCLITGASSGFGEHFARLLSGKGARVVLGARRLARVETLAESIRTGGGEALPVAMDVTDEGSVIAGFDAAEAAFGLVDTVIANAGVMNTPARSTDIPADNIRSVFDTNILGVLLTAREAAKRMIAGGVGKTGKGRVLIVGSIAAETIIAGEAAYCASKAAVAHLGRNLAREWVRMGINVNVIQPGYVLTELTAKWSESEAGKAQIAAFHRRRLQQIASLNEPVAYFCSDAAASTTGAVLTIDDGQSL